MVTNLSTFLLSSFVLLQLITLSSPTHPSSASFPCHPQDHNTLLQIKQAFNNHPLFSSLTPRSNCCNSDLVTCDPKHKRVVEFFLHDSNITGKIPPLIGNLTHLKFIQFSNLPNLIGEIPAEICTLKYLFALNININQLSGSVPECLGRIKNLHQLDLSENRLTGSIPATLGNLTKLIVVDLSGNRLTGKIPDLITGSKKVGPVAIYLSHNEFSGEIPKSMGSVNIKYLDLGWNRLEGDASHVFNRSGSMKLLTLCGNSLDFDLSEAGIPARSLRGLDISFNRIRGRIPAEILGAKKLRWFNVSYNRLCGEIPRGEIMEKFGYSAFFHNRCLCGPPLGACKSG